MVLRGLVAVASLVAELHSVWDLSRSGIKPVSPALVGAFFTTESPGKPLGAGVDAGFGVGRLR